MRVWICAVLLVVGLPWALYVVLQAKGRTLRIYWYALTFVATFGAAAMALGLILQGSVVDATALILLSIAASIVCPRFFDRWSVEPGGKRVFTPPQEMD